MTFFEELRKQRWDDHRYYHHNRINQTLHLLSAMCFVASYVLLFVNPVAAVFIGWLLAMVLRQSGHFFFEPQTFDEVSGVSHEYKEDVKVGYNLRRKVVLLSIWVAAPIVLLVDPTLFGSFATGLGAATFLEKVAYCWLALGVAAVAFRTIQLFFVSGVQTGLVWFTKILTDPFHDIKIYHRAPYHWLKGEMYDDMSDWYDRSVTFHNA